MRLKTGAMALVTNPKYKEQHDMKHLKIMGLCLVAALALSVVVVASASAITEPELRAKGGGAIVKNKFTGKGTSATYVLETKGQGAITCKALTVEGEVKTSKESELTTTFTECSAFGIAKCNSEEAESKEGRIRAVISSVPRWSPGSRTAVLFLLTILPRTRQIRLNCGGTLQRLNINGGFLLSAGNINEPHIELKFAAKQKEGKQEFTKFETGEHPIGEKIEETTTLETEGSGFKSFGKTVSGEEAAGEATFEEEVELRFS